jgi:copper(I)-binding protein
MNKLIQIAFATALAMSGFAFTATAHEAKIGSMEIEHPWSRETKAGAEVAAGFMSITNTGTVDDRLIAATAEISDMVQLHDMKMEGDVMKMSEVKGGILIPAGQTVVLKPKSLHIMMMNIKSHPKQDEYFKGTLTFEKAGKGDIEFMVEAPDAGM